MKAVRIFILAVLGVGVAHADQARAQTLLRWKLTPGEELSVAVEQQTTSQVAFSGKSATTKIDLAMELVWKVAAADDKEILLHQSLRRLKFKLDSPKAGLVEYDTAQKTRPTGSAREVAEAIKPLMDAEVAITMNERGEVLAAKPHNAAAEALFSDTPAAAEATFSKATIQKLLKQPLAVLPEESVASGDTWTTTSDVAAALGPFRQTTTYRLAGEIEQDGSKVLKIESTGKLDPAEVGAGAPAAASKLTVKSHEQAGTLLFSAEHHRLVQAEQTQKLVTERPYRETTIVVTLSSTQKTTIKPTSP